MSDAASRSGQVGSTPEGGPIDEGVPASAPGAGQVQSTPEAGPLAEGEELKPPTLRDHLRGPILGLDDAPAATPQRAADSAASRSEVSTQERPSDSSRSGEDELRKWPPYSGKPVSEVGWREIGRYAAPVAAQAEKLAIQAIDLSARGLSKLARYLEARRQDRDSGRG
jgi:hypothetical protein